MRNKEVIQSTAGIKSKSLECAVAWFVFVLEVTFYILVDFCWILYWCWVNKLFCFIFVMKTRNVVYSVYFDKREKHLSFSYVGSTDSWYWRQFCWILGYWNQTINEGKFPLNARSSCSAGKQQQCKSQCLILVSTDAVAVDIVTNNFVIVTVFHHSWVLFFYCGYLCSPLLAIWSSNIFQRF